MSLLATYPDFTLPLGSAQPAYYLSTLPSLVPFTSPSLLSFPLTQLSASQPEAGPACHEPRPAGLAPDRLVVSGTIEGLSPVNLH